MPLLSRNAIKERFEKLNASSGCDNVLLEQWLALEMCKRGLIDRVYPIFIGDYDSDAQQHGDYFQHGCGPGEGHTTIR